MIVALIGLLISFYAYFIAFPHPHQRRFDVYLLLFAMHVATTVTYWLLSFETAMDAFTYWRDPYGFASRDPFYDGTTLIVHVVQFIRRTLGGSFLDHFLFFQCFGMIGVALLARCINELADSLRIPVPLYAYAILFFPGVHFWSVAIGKDAPMIMATCLSLWAAMRIERRFLWMAVALVIMGMIRPHVAAIALGAIVGALFLTKSLPRKYKVTIGPMALVALLYVAYLGLDRLGVGDADLESVSDFVEYQQSLGERFGSDANIQNLPFPLKVLTLLFRPLWVDASGLLALVASAENTILLGIFGYIGFHWRMLLRLCRNVPYVSYSVIFSTVLIVLLSLVSYNVGLGQRQKMMAMPAVLMIYATIYIYKRYLAAAAAAATAQAQVPAGGGYGQPSQA